MIYSDRDVGGDGSRQGGWQADRQEKYVLCIQSFVLFKVFYTSPPSTPVHSNSISTSQCHVRNHLSDWSITRVEAKLPIRISVLF